MAKRMLKCKYPRCRFKTSSPRAMGVHYKENPSHMPPGRRAKLAKTRGSTAFGPTDLPVLIDDEVEKVRRVVNRPKHGLNFCPHCRCSLKKFQP